MFIIISHLFILMDIVDCSVTLFTNKTPLVFIIISHLFILMDIVDCSFTLFTNKTPLVFIIKFVFLFQSHLSFNLLVLQKINLLFIINLHVFLYSWILSVVLWHSNINK